jgi:hypothetical protein
MKHQVKRFKSMEIGLKELESFVRDGTTAIGQAVRTDGWNAFARGHSQLVTVRGRQQHDAWLGMFHNTGYPNRRRLRPPSSAGSNGAYSARWPEHHRDPAAPRTAKAFDQAA